jgi:predicted nuclease with TOPRIM domain
MDWIKILEIAIGLGAFTVITGGILWRFSERLAKIEAKVDDLTERVRYISGDVNIIDEEKKALASLYNLLNGKLDILITKFDLVITGHEKRMDELGREQQKHMQCFYYNKRREKKSGEEWE